MRINMKYSIVAILLLVLSSIALARELPEAAATSSGGSEVALQAGPILSHDILWLRPILTIIAIMFILAFVVGPVVRKEVPQEMPPVHSHDEPPGASGHHGPGGTIDPQAPDVHHH
jgi:hypothetical protein